MSNQNKLRNRLDDLFADLEGQAEQIRTEENIVPGWTWECNPQGIYTVCSPEIKHVLGLDQNLFVGQDFFSFRLDPSSTEKLQTTFRENNFPIEVVLNYYGTLDKMVLVRAHIFPIESIDTESKGWRGFNNVIQSDDEARYSSPMMLGENSQVPSRRKPHLLSMPTTRIAVDKDQVFTVDSPSSSSGEVSLHRREALIEDGTQDSPAALAVPVDLHDQSLGVLEIFDDSPTRKWSQDERLLVEQVADQLALALENAHLFQETQNSLSRTEALYNVGQAAVGFEDLDELLRTVVNTLANVLPADRAEIAVIDNESKKVTHLYRSKEPPVEITDDTYSELMKGLMGRCILEQKPILLSKGSTDSRGINKTQSSDPENYFGSVLVVPMIYRGIIFGAISTVNEFDGQNFTEGDLDLLSAMSTQIATALANARLFQHEQQRRQIADTLSETARVVGSTLNLEDVGSRLLSQLSDVLDFDTASLQVVEGNQRRQISGLSKLAPVPTKLSSISYPSISDDLLISPIINTRSTLAIPDTHVEPRWNLNLEKQHVRSWIGSPLLSGDEVIGLLILEHSEPGKYDEDTADFLSAIAAQVSVAIRNAGLFQQIQRRSIQLQTAAEVSRAASSILEPNPLIQQTVNLIKERFSTYYVGLFLVDDSGKWAILSAGTGEAGRIQIEREHKLEIDSGSMIGTCIRTAEAQTPKSITADTPRFFNPLLPETQTEIALPLISRGDVIGAMSIQSEIENSFSGEDVAILQTMADQVANALQNANLFDQTQARAEELAVLNEMSQTLSRNLDVESILRNIYIYASRLVDTSTFFIALYNETSNELSFPFSTEQNQEIVIPTRQLSSGLTEFVIHRKEPLLINSNVEDWLKDQGVELRLTGAMPQSWLGVPLMIGEQNLGIICVQDENPDHFSNHHKDLLNAVANQSAIALQNAQLFTQTQEALAETETLLNITSIASSSFDLQKTLSEVLDQILRSIQSDAGLISILNPETNVLDLVAHRLPEQMAINILENGLGGTLCDWVYKQEIPLVLEDFSENSPNDASGAIALGFKSYQGVPLEAKGRILGTLCTFSSRLLSSTDNDLKLLQAVGQQIGVAIENANLFEQTQDQTTELEILNEMSQVLSTLFDINEIIKTIHKYTSRLMDTTCFLVALYNRREDEVSFPFVTEQNMVSSIPAMKKREGLTQYVIDTKAPLLITENVKQKLSELGLDEINVGAPAESWLGVPLIIGDNVLGVIATQNADTPRVFNERHQDLLISVARQSAIAIQTARLFQETQQQTDDLAVLNELGHFLTNILDRREIMRTVFEYSSKILDTTNFFIATYLPKEQLVNIEFNIIYGQEADGLTRVLGSGLTDYILKTRQTLLLEEDIPEHMDRLGIEMIALGDASIPLSWLGVPMLVGNEAVGVIAVQSITKPRLYNERHRDILLSIASQAAISIQNAQLFEQVQSALDDMATLYQAGSALNSVQSYDDILEVLRKHTILGRNSTNISISLFDRPWTQNEQPSWFVPIAHWSTIPNETPISKQYPLSSWINPEQLLSSERPTIIEDPDNDPRLDTTAKNLYPNIQYAKGLIFTPLVVAGAWFGYINAIFSIKQTFSEEEAKRMTTLVEQAAVAIQNLRSLDETIRKAGQLETAAEIARDTSATLSMDEILKRGVNAVRDRFGFYHASIFLLDDSEENAVIHAATGEAGAELIHQKHSFTIGSQSIIGTVTQSGVPLVINDINKSDIHHPHPLLPDTQAELGIPLKIGERVLGAMDVQSLEINAFNEDDVSVLQTLTDQISVGIDNARSYQLAQTAIEETRRRVQDLTTLSQASQSLASAPLELGEVALIIVEQLNAVVKINTSIAISLKDGIDPNYLSTIISSVYDEEQGVIKEDDPEKWNFSLSEFPATAKVINTQKPLVIHISNPDADPNELAYMSQQSVGTLLMLPLVLKGQAIGVIEIETLKEEYKYTDDEINLLSTLANQAAISLENARLYEEQIETAEQLRELDQLKSQFLANMSHELRTPLNSIIGFSRVIMKGIDGPVTDHQQQDLSAIYNAGQHLLKMINDILDVSKIDAGKMELSFEDVNVVDIISSVLSTARGLVKDKPIELITAIEDDLPIITADSTRIRQILLNLISNATKFTDRGSITVSARQQLNDKGTPEVYIGITDTGIGIPPEDQKKLFEPFVQVDGSPTRTTGGTGLGLSITRMLVEMHRGEIGLESEVNKGSNFFFTLPIGKTTPPPPSVEGKTTILAIDDDIQVIQLYERYLNGTAFQIIPLDDPSSALLYASEIQPFAITLDIQLPDHDGWQLLDDLKNNPETKDIPIVICSILNESEKGAEMGADDYLVKPILADDFINVMCQIWEKSFKN